MPLPDAIPPFARIADERFQDARALLDQSRTTGAVYLVSYAVECTLKSILMRALPENKVRDVYAQFRVKGHDINWLTRQSKGRRVDIPQDVEKGLAYFQTDTVGLRYNDQAIEAREASEAFAVAGTILEWGKRVELQIVELNGMVHQISDLLNTKYLPNHPDASIDVFRRSPDQIWLRVVDPAFVGKSKMERLDMIWPILNDLPQDVRLHINLTLLITPEEQELSMQSMEFDDPSRGLL